MSNQIQKIKNEIQVADVNPHVLLNKPAFMLSFSKVYNVVLEEVSKCYLALGWKQPARDDLNLMVTELTNNINTKFRQLRIEEIPTAFYNGTRKEYGEYMGLNIVTFEIFIKSYLSSRYRTDLAKAVPAIEAPKEPTKEDRFNIAAFNAIRAFGEYKQGKDVSLVAPTVYKFLMALKCFKYSEEEQAGFIAEATKDVVDELTRQKATVLDKIKRLDIARQLDKPSTLEEKILLQARRLGLYNYFKSLIIDDVDLQNLIIEKRNQII